MATTAIDKIIRHAQRIAAGKERVSPGMPARFTEAASVGDGIWQGDLGIQVVDRVPPGFTRAAHPSAQLVPGTTQGSRHCLDSLDGVEVFLPRGWGESYDGLDGPCMRLAEERTVLHPTHGAVTIPAGFTVQCRYQREFDAEQRRERRNAD